MTTTATGTFHVQLDHQPPDDLFDRPFLGRLSLRKTFQGDLEAVSHGQMLSAGTRIPDSAGYVALEFVDGTLDGRAGTFVLQHSATMRRGTGQLHIHVVPDSGTGQLEGLTGDMTIIREDGQHTYHLEYTLSLEPD